MQNPNYANLSTEARKAARHMLRLEMVSDIQGNIFNFKKEVKRIQKHIDDLTQQIKLKEYHLEIARNTSHPDLERITKQTEDHIKQINENIKKYQEGIKKPQAAIKEAKERITAIQNGELKVSYQRLSRLGLGIAQEYIRKNFLESEIAEDEEES